MGNDASSLAACWIDYTNRPCLSRPFPSCLLKLLNSSGEPSGDSADGALEPSGNLLPRVAVGAEGKEESGLGRELGEVEVEVLGDGKGVGSRLVEADQLDDRVPLAIGAFPSLSAGRVFPACIMLAEKPIGESRRFTVIHVLHRLRRIGFRLRVCRLLVFLV